MFRDSGRESDIEGTRFTPPSGSAGFTLPNGTAFPPGSFIYSHPVPGSSTVLCGTPPDGARLVYGPPPSNLTIPLVPSGTLHCNVPGHQDMVRDTLCRIDFKLNSALLFPVELRCCYNIWHSFTVTLKCIRAFYFNITFLHWQCLPTQYYIAILIRIQY